MRAFVHILPIVVALLSSCCGNVSSVSPGFKARLTQKGIDYLRDVGLGILKKEMSSLVIPPISGTAHIKVGKVDYTVSNMKVNSFNIPSATLIPDPTIGGVVLNAKGLSLAMHGDWRYKAHIAFIDVKDHGTFDVSATGLSLRVAIRIGMDSAGRPTVSTQAADCSFSIGSLHAKFHGGASWIYNLFDSAIEHELEKELSSQACGLIGKEVNEDLTKELATMNLIAKIDDIAEIDYSLVSKPTFQGSINMANKGEVFPIGKRTEAPFPVPPIRDDPDTSNMMNIWITQYLLETAGYVYYKAGYFQYNLTQDDIPAGAPISLNTSSLIIKGIFPEVGKLFPNMLMQVNANASQPPDINMKPEALNGTVVFATKFYVQLPNKTMHYLCTLQLSVYASASLGFKGANITWHADYIRTDIKLIDSTIGKVNTKSMNVAVDFAMKLFLLPLLNNKGKTGFPLPTVEDVHFENPVLKLDQGYFKLGVDVRYTGL